MTHVAQFPAGHLAPAPRTLVDIVLEITAQYPEAPALDDGTTVLSYTELLEAMRAMAIRLARAGVGPGDKVGVRVPSGTVDLYVSILGTLMIGAAYVPVDVDDPDERAETVFSEAAVAAVVTAGPVEESAPAPEALPGHRAQVTITTTTTRDFADRPALRAPEPEDDCWVIFTSGSTGKPKGVAVTHRSAAAFVDAEARMFLQDEPLEPGDRVLAGLSVAFDASCEEMWLAWGHGACLVPAPRSLVKSGTDLGPWLASRRITVVSTVPTLAALWPAESLSNVRLLIFGGEACPPELAARLSDGTREVWNTYGPTEATVVACGSLLTGEGPVRIGLPLDGWDLAIVDPATGIPVPEGATGELIIGGVGLARYLDPEKDREKYAPLPTLGWERAYRSGDLVVNDPEGLVFVGRADEQIKLGGRRIELGEVDAALQSLPGVRGGAAAVKTTPGGTQLLVGYLVAEVPPADTETEDAAKKEWTDRLRESLPPALVPRLALVDDLPTKTSGKVDRNALPWPLASVADDSAAGDLPENARWLAGQWADVLGGTPGLDTDFFDAGGGSLAAAQLVSKLRVRHPQVTVGDLYARPRFGALVEMCTGEDTSAEAPAPVHPRTVEPVLRRTRFWQTVLGIPLHVLAGMRWVVLVLIGSNLAAWAGAATPQVSWWWVLGLGLVFVTPWGRMLLSALAARVLLAGLRPGTYRRSGGTHMRLWFAEHVQDLLAAVSPASAPWVTWYARLLGNDIADDVDLHSVPPVTGMLTLARGAAVEPEVDLKGWWVDGDLVHVGTMEVGEYATVGARTTLMPGAKVGAGAVVEAGSAVTGKIKKNRRYSGSPAVRVGNARGDWPDPPQRRAHLPFLLYALGSLVHAAIPYLAALPALALVALVSGVEVFARPLVLLAWSPVAALVWFASCALLVLLAVRSLGIGLTEGVYPVRSFMAYRVWATERLMDLARDLLFPLYAGMLTPVWLRLLGTKVGREVEASTVLLIPRMTQIADGAFLADDTMIGSYELGHGWMRIGRAKVGKRAFVGNSGMTAAGRKVPKNALVAVLSAAPAKSRKGSSWVGSPPVEMRRTEVAADESLTYAPPTPLKVLRGMWETLRVLAVLAAGVLLVGVLVVLLELLELLGAPLTVAVSGIVMMAAGAVAAGLAVLAKWVFIGPIRSGDHPLWSAFIWRTEVADCFVELVAAPWFTRLASGTPALVWYLRALGARIGHGVWCESYWLPEADLVHLDDASTVNRGCVVQTHLFHDRVMSLDTVHLAPGSTLGPNSVILPAAELGESATVGPVSLVMRGESVPAHTHFTGNPVVPWTDAPRRHVLDTQN
ncbi:Pls/PosA family non-ribosomal peptide synthetase [Brevibacterium samyangense]|uniref:Non-ribosomal peptide synthetase n=1 Tax=Brevibacterium samyangense TaxID=366888 RepID=A0ABN2TDB1_9MICO